MSNKRLQRDESITAEDMSRFVQSNSDFGFEMKVLAQLKAMGFECSHSGTYVDPVTGKTREFDIRAVRKLKNFELWLAVECKNLRPNFPLLISAVPRTEAEAFHCVALTSTNPSATRVTVFREKSLYKAGEMVGKTSNQVGRLQDGELTSNDEATFDKLNQAINSSKDLMHMAVSPGHSIATTQHVVLPMLVVPAGTLWQVDYSIDGAVLKAPRIVSHSNLFRNMAWNITSGHLQFNWSLTHIELVSFEALSDVIQEFLTALLPPVEPTESSIE